MASHTHPSVAPPPAMLAVFNKQYYTRFYKHTLLHRLFVNRVHRREPVFSYLRHHIPAGSALLDIGCGSGNFLRFAQHHFACTGIDISPDALALAKECAPHARLLQRSMYELDRFKPHSFDVITCFDVMEHIDDVDTAFLHISRLLKPQGIFVMTSPNPLAWSWRLKGHRWLNWRDPSHLWFFSPSEWGFLAKRTGLVPVKFFFDGLCDPPYLPLVPAFIQTVVFKFPTQTLALLGLPVPSRLSENFTLIAEKAPGWQSGQIRWQKSYQQALRRLPSV